MLKQVLKEMKLKQNGVVFYRLDEQERENFPPEDPEWIAKTEEVAEFVFKTVLDDLGHDLLDDTEQAKLHFESYVSAFEVDMHEAMEKRFRRLAVAQKRRRGE